MSNNFMVNNDNNEYDCEGRCPKCNSDDFDFQGAHDEDYVQEERIRCNKCGCVFQEVSVSKYAYTEILEN